MPSPFYTPEHEAFRATVRRFVDREIMPHVDTWDEAEEFPRELYKRASAAGLLQLGFPRSMAASRPIRSSASSRRRRWRGMAAAASMPA
jgi:alkylation response protein AidB-like acyl-CoA dehydrogenase